MSIASFKIPFIDLLKTSAVFWQSANAELPLE